MEPPEQRRGRNTGSRSVAQAVRAIPGNPLEVQERSIFGIREVRVTFLGCSLEEHFPFDGAHPPSLQGPSLCFLLRMRHLSLFGGG